MPDQNHNKPSDSPSDQKPSISKGDMLMEPQSPRREEYSSSIDPEAVIEQKRKVFNRTILLALLVLSLAAFIPMLKIFLIPMILASTFAVLFFPLYRTFHKTFRGNRGLAAFACCLVLVLGLMIPAYILGSLVVHQIYTLYVTIEPVVRSVLTGENQALLDRIYAFPAVSWMRNLNIEWQSTALETLKTTGTALAQLVNHTSFGAITLLVTLFMTLFIMFYLFMDGEAIVKKTRYLVPLRPAYQDMIINRFVLVSRATVKGVITIALVQATLGSLTLLIFGIKSWILWGVVMFALGMIPLLGAWMVLIPAAIIKFATSHPWQGIIIFLISISVVSTIDNILRPRLVGQNARMHDLLIFFSTIGGLSVFGPAGVIAGPVIAALFLAIVEIYGIEFKSALADNLE
jgi:predicted PurR-regulated permease PerM